MDNYIFDVAERNRTARRDSWKWLLGHLASSKLKLFVFVFGAIAVIFLNTYIPRLIGQMIDEAIIPKDTDRLTSFIILLMVVGVTKIVLNFVNVWVNNSISWSSIKRIRVEFFENLQSKPLRFHNRVAVGDLMALATQDMQQLGGMINPGLSMMIQAFVGLAMVIFFALGVNWQYTVFLTPFFVVYVYSIRWYNREMNPISQTFNYKWSLISRSAQESITGVRVVRAFNGEEYEMRQFRQVVEDFKDTWYRRQLITAKYWPLLVIFFTVGFSFFLSVIFYGLGRMSFGDVVAVNGMLILLIQPTFIISFAVNMFQQGLAGGERIFHTMYAAYAEQDDEEEYRQWSADLAGTVKFENVNFKYEGTEKYILRDISFEAKQDERIAIVGPTGSGKTTLTKLLSRFYPYEGSIQVGGIDIQEFNLRDLRQNIGRVEQDIFLFSSSIRDNITFGMGDEEVTEEEIILSAKTAQAHDFILDQPDGYETILGERGVGLSGGQRQRIAIARCILTNPKILVLDDSTSAIDAKTEEQITEAMEFVMKGRTTFLITHRLGAIRKADRVMVLMNGTIAAFGPHEELITTSKAYRRIFRNSVELPPLQEGL